MQHRVRLKSRIDAAALHLFAERGADATPMPMIAEAAGAAVGSLYRYYANKEELVAKLYADNYARLAGELDRVQAETTATHDKIAAMVRFVCGFFDREWDLARFLLLEQHLRLKNYDGPANPVDIVCRVLADGVRLGELKPVDVTLAALSDRPLSEAERRRLARWVDAGAPRGEATVTIGETKPTRRPRPRLVRTLDVVIPVEARVPPGVKGLGPGGPVACAVGLFPRPARLGFAVPAEPGPCGVPVGSGPWETAWA